MKKKVCSRIVIAILTFSFILATPLVAFGYTTVQSVTVKNNFNKAWLKSKDTYYKGYRVVLTYGYNTTFINEDTCATYTTGDLHRSSIKNGTGVWKNSKWYATREWSNLEIRHNGNAVIYEHDWKG